LTCCETAEYQKKKKKKFWSTQELKYNWQVEITGTGSRSEIP